MGQYMSNAYTDAQHTVGAQEMRAPGVTAVIIMRALGFSGNPENKGIPLLLRI